jgi:hypothetical protein
MYGLVAEANQNAKALAEAAQKELADVSELLAMNGQKKTVRLVHDEHGRTVGAVVVERTH